LLKLAVFENKIGLLLPSFSLCKNSACRKAFYNITFILFHFAPKFGGARIEKKLSLSWWGVLRRCDRITVSGVSLEVIACWFQVEV
jgi:hypothetical protein